MWKNNNVQATLPNLRTNLIIHSNSRAPRRFAEALFRTVLQLHSLCPVLLLFPPFHRHGSQKHFLKKPVMQISPHCLFFLVMQTATIPVAILQLFSFEASRCPIFLSSFYDTDAGVTWVSFYHTDAVLHESHSCWLFVHTCLHFGDLWGYPITQFYWKLSIRVCLGILVAFFVLFADGEI